MITNTNAMMAKVFPELSLISGYPGRDCNFNSAGSNPSDDRLTHDHR
jgi:hypothetical protein